MNINMSNLRQAKPAPKHYKSNGAMIACSPNPDVAEKLKMDGGLPADELHCTLAYLGKADSLDKEALEELPNLVEEWVASKTVIAATICGIGRFTGGDDGDPLIALVDSPQLTAYRPSLLNLLRKARLPAKTDHGFTAHMTLSYLDTVDRYVLRRFKKIDTTFDHIEIHVAGRITRIPLKSNRTLSARLLNVSRGNLWL